MRLEIGGGKGVTREQFLSIVEGLNQWHKRHWGWTTDDAKFFDENGIGITISGNIPIKNLMVEDLEKIFLDHGLGLGTAPDQIAMLLFPG